MGYNTTRIVTTPDGSKYIEYVPADVSELLKIRADMEAMKDKPRTFADVAHITRRLAKIAERLGGYYLAVPEALLSAGQQYYSEHAGTIRAALEQGGADAETVEAVLYDYGAALCGMYNYKATPEQMQNALRACGPAVAFRIDKVGFYIGLLYCYQRNLNALAEYQKGVKQEPDAAKRDLFFMSSVAGGVYTDLRAAALLWLENIGYITASDFAGIDTPTIENYLGYIDLYGNNGQFVQYVFTAKQALNATPEQLAELTPPPLFAGARVSPIQAALNYADIIGEEIAVYLERVAEQVEAPAPQDRDEQAPAVEDYGTPEPQAAAPQGDGTNAAPVEVLTGEITAPVEAGNPDGENAGTPGAATRPVINMPENLALLNSRDLWGAGEAKGEPLPMPAIVADFRKRFPQYADIDSYAVQRAIDGINILRQSDAARFDGDKWTFEVTISEFSTIAYGFDANERQKRELLTALKILNDYYVIVWRQRGRVAVKLLTVREAELDKGERSKLRVEVYANALRGRPNFVSLNEYETMKKTVTGESKFHFLFQMIGGNNKKENALITEVFGYDTKKKDAEQNGGPEQLAAVKEYERLHRPRDRKYLQKWFEEWAALGLISYKRYQNKAGQWVYKWKRLKPLTPQEKAVIEAARKQYSLPE